MACSRRDLVVAGVQGFAAGGHIVCGAVLLGKGIGW